MENGATHTQWSTLLSTIIKSEFQREILHLGSVCKVPLCALSSRLCFFYFWFSFLFFSFCFFPKLLFHPILQSKKKVNLSTAIGRSAIFRRLCHVVVAVWLSLAGSGWALRPVASQDVAQDLILRARADLSWCQSLRRA